jgi:hypothetical protein
VIGLDVIGPTSSGAILAVPDDVDDPTRRAFVQWAKSTALGPLARSVQVVTHRDVLNPDHGRLAKAYTGAEWVVTADGGRSLGLLAQHWGRATDPFWRGGISLGVEHWGRKLVADESRGRRRSEWEPMLHRPIWRAKPISSQGLMAKAGAAGKRGLDPDNKPAGRWERDPSTGAYRPSKGHFVDLIGEAHADDGLDTSDLSEHLEAFGIPAPAVSVQARVDPGDAQVLLDLALAVHQLALAIDKEATSWGLGFGEVYSPGGVAQQQWRATGLVPPLDRFANLDDAELDRWSAAAHGGWQA